MRWGNSVRHNRMLLDGEAMILAAELGTLKHPG